MQFRGKYDFLSNFYPCEIKGKRFTFSSAEHAFQAAKTRNPVEQKLIADCETPAMAKAYGRRVSLREDWNSIRVMVMERALRIKFSDANPHLVRRLLATGDTHLVEDNTWNDTFWGVCRGRGENHLGKLLMKIREEIRSEAS